MKLILGHRFVGSFRLIEMQSGNGLSLGQTFRVKFVQTVVRLLTQTHSIVIVTGLSESTTKNN